MTHAELQAVEEDGTSSMRWTGKYPFVLRGVLLCGPDELVDPTWREGAAMPADGGQFQVFLQSVEAGDRGGTAVYMSQKQPPGMGGEEYGAAEWAAELARVDGTAAGRRLRAGDLVEVAARVALAYNGKANVNEGHRTKAENDFEIRVLRANVGLPRAEKVRMADLYRLEGTNSVAIFDATRETGGEHWQGMRVRMDGLRLVTTNGWCATNGWADRVCVATDGEGRTMPLRLSRYGAGACPGTERTFSAIGILNQEGSNTGGYELVVQETGPVVELAMGDGGREAEVSFAGDYADMAVEFSDDGGETWQVLDVTPEFRVVVREETDGTSRRFYRLGERAD